MKLFGLFLVVSSFTFTGVALANGSETSIKQLRVLVELIRHIRLGISHTRLPIWVILDGFETKERSMRSFFLLQRARSKDWKGWRRGSDTLDQKCGQAGLPQINNGSGAFESLVSRIVLHPLRVKLHLWGIELHLRYMNLRLCHLKLELRFIPFEKDRFLSENEGTKGCGKNCRADEKETEADNEAKEAALAEKEINEAKEAALEENETNE